MGTRSNIGILNDDGSVTYIYCHWDGYVEYNGKILYHHYTTESKVRELLSLGNLSSLNPEIGIKHGFNDDQKIMCTFYGRDRGEKEDVSSQTAPTIAEYVAEHGQEYNYLFDPKTNEWSVNSYSSKPEDAFILLKDHYDLSFRK